MVRKYFSSRNKSRSIKFSLSSEASTRPIVDFPQPIKPIRNILIIQGKSIKAKVPEDKTGSNSNIKLKLQRHLICRILAIGWFVGSKKEILNIRNHNFIFF